jgi:hypothetical protein
MTERKPFFPRSPIIWLGILLAIAALTVDYCSINQNHPKATTTSASP